MVDLDSSARQAPLTIFCGCSLCLGFRSTLRKLIAQGVRVAQLAEQFRLTEREVHLALGQHIRTSAA